MDQTKIILFQALFTFAGILISSLVSYLFGRDKYVFEKSHDKKLTILAKMYEMVVKIENQLKIYALTTGYNRGSESAKEKGQSLLTINYKILDLQNYFAEHEIFLSDETVNVVKSFLKITNTVFSKLHVSAVAESQNDISIFLGKLDEAYDAINSELANAKEKIKAEFSKILNFA